MEIIFLDFYNNLTADAARDAAKNDGLKKVTISKMYIPHGNEVPA